MSRRTQKALASALILLVTYIVSQVIPPVAEEGVAQNAKEYVEVVRVVDGDTLVVRRENNDEKVRLIGIDAPESVDPRKPVECMGKEASNYLKELISGKFVYLEKDSTQGEYDKYHRLLRYVYVGTSTESVNETLIRNGYAHEYTYNKAYVYQSEFKASERLAKENNMGLWNSVACGN